MMLNMPWKKPDLASIGTSKCSKGIFLALVFSFILPVLLPRHANAIPAFTRLYKTECSSCHTIFPQRNEFGDAFQKNGYVWPGGKP